MRSDFAIFIPTHKRPNTQYTLDLLRNCGYTGEIFLVVDDLDPTVNEYKSKYGDKVLVFNKLEYVNKTDTGMSVPQINFAVFARNAIEDFAITLGYKFFAVFDDDMVKFRYRYDDDGVFRSTKITINMDKIIDTYVSFIDESNISCVSFGSLNNYMRGVDSLYIETSRLRLCCAIFFRNTNFKVDWKLNMCEDRITSLYYGQLGQVWLQLLQVQLDTMPMGGEFIGGNTDVYKSLDKFHQVFFPVIVLPSSQYCSMYKGKWATVMHQEYVCPKIISGGYKK